MTYFQTFLFSALMACGGAPAVVPDAVCTSPFADDDCLQVLEPQELNGKQGKLRFDTQSFDLKSDVVAVGADEPLSIVVFRRPAIGHTPIGTLWTRAAQVRADFDSGISGAVDTRNLPGWLNIEVKCTRKGIFDIRVEAKDANHLVTDEIAIRCGQATRLEFSAGAPPPNGRTMLGGSITAYLVAFDENVRLWGQFAVQVKSGDLLEKIAPYTFKTRGTGNNPIITGLGVELALPIEIVDVPWRIKMNQPEIQQISDSLSTIKVAAAAIASDGTPLRGLAGCAFTSQTGDAITALPNQPWGDCDVFTYPEVAEEWKTLSKANRLCVSAMEKSECIELVPR